MRIPRSHLPGPRAELMGYSVVEMGGGRCRLEWRPGPMLANPTGIVHGGFVAVMVDDTCGTAVASLLDDLKAFPTASMRVEFLRGIPVGGVYACVGVVVRAGRRLTVVDAAVEDEGGRLLARGSCTFALDLVGSELAGFSAL